MVEVEQLQLEFEIYMDQNPPRIKVLNILEIKLNLIIDKAKSNLLFRNKSNVYKSISFVNGAISIVYYYQNWDKMTSSQRSLAIL